MRILIISDEVWNDQIHGNNILTNWFNGFDAEFANIYCSPGIPDNPCCYRYFQITDKMMAYSILTRQKSGTRFDIDKCKPASNEKYERLENENVKLYSFLKGFSCEILRAIRDFIWLYGRYDEKKMHDYIMDFNPDIIFCPRFATVKILRLERLVSRLSKAPMIAFTGDDEYSLRQCNYNPIYWVRRLLLRKTIRKTMPIYKKYYTLTEEQMTEYRNIFNIEMDVLKKCGEFQAIGKQKEVNKPIREVYAGRLYSNRWKTLSALVKAMQSLNKDKVSIILEIYTKDEMTSLQKKLLQDNRSTFVKGSVRPEKLREIYEAADIALHVEAFDKKNRLLTRLSFSTKIIDCLASGCAVMAICWHEHAGYKYLKNNDAAICIESEEKIYDVIKKIAENSEIISEYKNKANKCGLINHQRSVVQEKLYDDFRKVVEGNYVEGFTN